MTDVIAVFGSARRNGNTGKLMDWIARELNIEVIDLADKDISAFDYEHNNRGDDFLPVVKQLLKYQKIIFATPIYWYGPSAQMKVFIDRTSDFLDIEELKDIGRQLRTKTAYIVCTSISEEADSSFINAMTDTFEYLGINYGGHIHANCEKGYVQTDYQEQTEQFLTLLKN